MKIISSFKDYYDYVGFIGGREDSRVVYKRPEVFPQSGKDLRFTEYGSLKDLPSLWGIWARTNKEDELYFKWCAIAGKQYLLSRRVVYNKQTGLVQESESWRFLHKDDPNYHLMVERRDRLDLFNPNSSCNLANWHGVKSEVVTKVSRKLGQPVFFFKAEHSWGQPSRTIEVEQEVPNLGALGLGKLLAAEQLYQEIEYFMGNLINENPDTQPPAEVSDKDKIKQHGFDLKTSFRRGKTKHK
jgi:hypothetical protein